MTTVSTAESIRSIPLVQIRVSTTGSQAERRAHFNKAAIAELAESIKTVGLLSPIVARPVKMIKTQGLNGILVGGKTYFSPQEAEEAAANTFELVAGERRFLAAKQAGLEAITVSVRDLTDEQVLEVQLIENLQREGLHELAEAEGYEALQKLGYSASEIADKVGKSKAYVYGRMKLLALSKDGRKAFYEGTISASIALLLARIPVAELQKEALKEILDGNYEGPLSFRQAQELVHNDYMTRLADAGFPTADATLVPSAGSCSACPKRTGNQPELFGDIKSADVCTDPVCFKSKREAQAARAREAGAKIISGEQAKKLAPYGRVSGSFVALEDRCYEDPKNRTYGQLLGKSYEATLLQDPETGKLTKIAAQTDVAKALKDAGIKPSSSSPNPQTAAEKKAKAERAFRQALFAKVRESYPTALERSDWNDLALAILHEMQQETTKQVFKLWGWEPVKGKYTSDYAKAAAAYIQKLTGAELPKLLLDCIFVSELQVSTWSEAKPEKLFAAAKRFKVNVDQVRRAQNAAAIPKSKKKTARKAK